MPSTYSTNLAIELIGTGDQAGVWGNTTNTNLGTLIEQAISGYVTQAVSTGTDTTITIPNGATGVARNMYIELTGTGGASTNLIVPANKKLYFIFNNTSSGQVTVKVSGQTGVSVPNKAKMVLVSNGTDIVTATNYVADFGSNSATITQLTSTSATITNLTLTSLVLSNLSIASANVTTLTSASATITNLLATSLTVSGNTFLATSSGNVGIGTSSPAAKLQISSGTGGDTTGLRITRTDAGGGDWRIWSTATANSEGAGKLIFGTSSNFMTLDGSGNLGIGTSSPKEKLDSRGAAVFSGDNTTGTNAFGTASGLLLSTSSDNTKARITAVSNGANSISLVLRSLSSGSAVDAVTIDPSGNLGLGVTPEAWFSTERVMRVGLGSGFGGRTNNASETNVYANAYINASGTATYIANGTATRYAQDGGKHLWYYAASGTAGNNISFTQAMTLDASGNLGVGTTSPGARLHASVTGAGIQDVSWLNNAQAVGANVGSRLVFTGTSSNNGLASIDGAFAGATTADGGYMTLSTRAVTSGTLTERARIDSSGNLGLGVTPSAWDNVFKNIQMGGGGYSGSFYSQANGDISNGIVLNAYYNGGWKYTASSKAVTQYEQNNGVHKWSYAASGTAGNAITFTQAMTLDSGGSLGVGTTSPGSIIHAQKPNGSACYLQLGQVGVESWQIGMSGGSSALAFLNSGTERARITSDGDFGIGTTSPGYRLEVFESGAVNVAQIKGDATDGSFATRVWQAANSGDSGFVVFLTETGGTGTVRGSIDYNRAGGQVRYNTTSDYRAKEVYGPIEDSGEQIDALKVYRGKMLGATQERPMMIAHEAQEVVPYAVGGEKDAVDEDGTPKYQTMDHQILVPLLIAELQSLRKRVAELEAK